jgi:hypothetical protein
LRADAENELDWPYLEALGLKRRMPMWRETGQTVET